MIKGELGRWRLGPRHPLLCRRPRAVPHCHNQPGPPSHSFFGFPRGRAWNDLAPREGPMMAVAPPRESAFDPAALHHIQHSNFHNFQSPQGGGFNAGGGCNAGGGFVSPPPGSPSPLPSAAMLLQKAWSLLPFASCSAKRCRSSLS